jgi:5-methylcytosine-specific restriction endonuclease McrA
MSASMRLYDPNECQLTGYPVQWDHTHWIDDEKYDAIKHQVRELAGHRCVRCGHPYRVGQTSPAWSPCDEYCTHAGPWRTTAPDGVPSTLVLETADGATGMVEAGWIIEASWRVLTVHHLSGVKYDCRWWNLVALCQRCHLSVQSRVVMDRVYPLEHTDWMKPYAAGWYADQYLGEDLTREETMERLDELLALERIL